MSSFSEVTFTDASGDVIKAMRNLSKKALRAGGKVIRNKLKASSDMTERMRNHIATSANIEKDTGQPVMKVGFYTYKKVKKNGKQASRRNPNWQEFGTKAHVIKRTNDGKTLGTKGYWFGKQVLHKGTPAYHTLRNVVNSNIDEIRVAEEKYLAELNGVIDEALKKDDYTEDIDDD